MDDREKYKAVFQDQYAEYKELFQDVHITLQKVKELENLPSKLPPRYWTKKVILHSHYDVDFIFILIIVYLTSN